MFIVFFSTPRPVREQKHGGEGVSTGSLTHAPRTGAAPALYRRPSDGALAEPLTLRAPYAGAGPLSGRRQCLKKQFQPTRPARRVASDGPALYSYGEPRFQPTRPVRGAA